MLSMHRALPVDVFDRVETQPISGSNEPRHRRFRPEFGTPGERVREVKRVRIAERAGRATRLTPAVAKTGKSPMIWLADDSERNWRNREVERSETFCEQLGLSRPGERRQRIG